MTDAPAPQPNEFEQRIAKRAEGNTALTGMLTNVDAAGNSALVIPSELSNKFNVLAASSVFTQQSSMFLPGIVTIELDPKTDFYTIDKQQIPSQQDANGWTPESYAMYYEIAKAHGLLDGKPQYHKFPLAIAINKVGLRKITSASTISFSDPRNAGADAPAYVDVEFKFGELVKVIKSRAFVYTAVGTIRQPDGTLKTFSAEKEWDPYMAAADCISAAENSKYDDTDQKRMKKAVTEFKRSFEFRRAMAKSKAQNAVIRDALPIKAKYTVEEATKPFFLLNFDFTPDANDANSAEIMRMMYGVGSATDALYGAAPTATVEVMDVPEAGEDAEIPDDVIGAEPTDVGPATDENIEDAEYEEIAATQGEIPPIGPLEVDQARTVDTSTGEVVAETNASPTFSMVAEPEDDKLNEDERAEYTMLGAYVMQYNNERNKTMSAVLAESGIKWFDEATAYFKAHQSALKDARLIDELTKIETFTALAHRVGV